MGFENADWQTACRPGITKAFLEHIMVEYEYFLQLGAQKFNKEAYAVFHVSASFRVCITSQNFSYCLPYAQAKESKIDDM
jgi:hypothetical protein